MPKISVAKRILGWRTRWHYRRLLKKIGARPTRELVIALDEEAAENAFRDRLEMLKRIDPREAKRREHQLRNRAFKPPEENEYINSLVNLVRFEAGMQKDHIVLSKPGTGILAGRHEAARAAAQAKYDERFKRSQKDARHGLMLDGQAELFACLHPFLLYSEPKARKIVEQRLKLVDVPTAHSDYTIAVRNARLLLALPAAKIKESLKRLVTRELRTGGELIGFVQAEIESAARKKV